MIRREITIINKSGLHVRPASILAKGAGGFESEITLLHGGQSFNAKSVIRLLAACIKRGETVQLQADGPDEQAALDQLQHLVQGGLGES